eukprot:TRINITY_DN59066_c0_g1_i1.p1 TRINITY_DN59066_c0_g1~~TRINITY_DN59066_c0_g1_i1.p1  ORF type:complete len:611 (+),score=95.73 TRINITY_DN59066_c0_g1_i1:96-1835(+)
MAFVRRLFCAVLFSAAGVSEGDLEADLAVNDECQDGECALNALQRHGLKVSAAAERGNSSAIVSGTKCALLSHPSNSICAPVVRWALQGGKYDQHAKEWFKDMMSISKVEYTAASLGDWQKLYYCAPPGGKQCGTPPCECSQPPCDVCFGGETVEKGGCGSDPNAIWCKPPTTAMGYNGMAWQDMTVSGSGPFSLFAIGDWGGLDGSLNPIESRPNLVVYSGGNKAGPSVFPRTRWNKPHSHLLCSHKQFISCYNTRGSSCAPGCGFVKGVDDQPQLLVASAMRARAAKRDPKFILNVGDNFYWGGIEKTCGTPMDELSYTAHHQFDQIFEGIYSGAGLDGKPWLSVLGNHDWGGRVFNNGWDQQIAYTWKSSRWVMPAAYWSQHVNFADAGFSMDLFMLDSNAMDAKELGADSEHNICGAKHNQPFATCASQGGPASLGSCKRWFWDLWATQQAWLPQKLSASKSDWQIAVTHFPCGHQKSFYMSMHSQHGLDLLVTGHRHDQELWEPSRLGGLTCFVTGGGGGISSEATPDASNKKDWYGEGQYGFYDLTVTKTEIEITSINWNGDEVKSQTVYPKQ